MAQNHLSKQETKNLPIISLLLVLIGVLTAGIYFSLLNFNFSIIPVVFEDFFNALINPASAPIKGFPYISRGISFTILGLIILTFFIYSVSIIINKNVLKLTRQLHFIQTLCLLVAISGGLMAIFSYNGLESVLPKSMPIVVLSTIRAIFSVVTVWIADKLERQLNRKIEKIRNHTIAFSETNFRKIRISSIYIITVQSFFFAPLSVFLTLGFIWVLAFFADISGLLYGLLALILSSIIAALLSILMERKTKRHKAIGRISALRNLSLANLVVYNCFNYHFRQFQYFYSLFDFELCHIYLRFHCCERYQKKARDCLI